jgi:type III secretion system YscQ/HrcQ family protein
MLRHITEEEHALRNEIGPGRLLMGDAADAIRLSNGFDTTITRLMVSVAEPQFHSTHTDGVLTLSTAKGVLQFSNSRRVMALLTGVPVSAAEDDRLGRLFDSVCVPRLSRTFFSAVAPLQAAAIEPDPHSITMQLIVECGDMSTLSVARAHPRFWRALLSNSRPIERSASSRRMDVEVETSIHVGRGLFPLSQLRELRAGDLLDFGAVTIEPDGTGHCIIADKVVAFEYLWSGRSISVQIHSIAARNESRHNRKTEESDMSDSVDNGAFDEQDDDGAAESSEESMSEWQEQEFAPELEERQHIDVEKIDIEVCVELGRLRMSIGALQDLQAGSVFKIAAAGDRTVTLKIAGGESGPGRTIAVGELVQVEDRLAVQVLRVVE